MDAGIRDIRVLTKHPGRKPAYRFMLPTDGNILRYIKNGPSYRVYELDPAIGLVLIGQAWMGEGKFNFNLQNHSYMGPVIICGRTDDGFTDLPVSFRELKERYPQLWDNQLHE